MADMTVFAEQLQQLEQAGRRRILAPRAGLDFASNDYLGLARGPLLQRFMHEELEAGVAHGSGGSRLLGGNDAEHIRLEEFAAQFYGAESALLFPTGFTANLALFGTLPQRGDLVLYDALIHASTHDGMRIGRAEYRAFAHNDCNALEDELRAFRQHDAKANIWIAVESLYSMEGDRAPLDALDALAERYGAFLVVDEAHAVGAFGDQGRGLSAGLPRSDNQLTLYTGGKALGLEGAIVTMPDMLRDFLINRGRPVIFSTAPSPLTAAVLRRTIAHLAEDASLRNGLADLIAHTDRALAGLCPPESADSQIFPVIIGEDAAAVALAQKLQAAGFDVRAIRPPTVPKGTARLRISLTLNVSADDVTALVDCLRAAMP